MTIELEKVAVWHAMEFLRPVLDLSDPEGLTSFLESMEWDGDVLGIKDPDTLAISVAEIAGAIQNLEGLFDQENIDLVSLAEALIPLTTGITRLVSAITSLKIADGIPQNALETLSKDVVSFLVERYVATHFPKFTIILELLGIFKAVDLPEIKRADGQVLRKATRRWVIDCSAFSQAFRDPFAYLRAEFLVDSNFVPRKADQLADLLGPWLADLLIEVGLTASYNPVINPGIVLTGDEAEAAKHLLILTGSFPSGPGTYTTLRLGIGLTDDGEKIGIVLLTSGELDIPEIPIANGSLTISLKGALDPLLITADSITFTNGGSGNFKASLGFQTNAIATPFLSFGSPKGIHFEVAKLQMSLEVTSESQFVDVGGTLDFIGMLLAIQGGDGDGFLNKILPSNPIEIKADIGLDISLRKGIKFRGGVGFETVISINKTILDTLMIESLYLALSIKQEQLQAVIAATANAKIGPVSATVEKIGLMLKYDFQQGKESNLGLGFKPPTGIGLSIDSSIASGGGYLSIDDGNYAGILQLDIADTVSITAIGILTTRMPDGTKIFSLKFFGMAEFSPIQLGFGFFLDGLGLAVAIHCSMNGDALRKSVYTGSLNSLMFPPDPIKNAVKIISDLQSFFPPEEGCYAFGIMVKLGWGGAKALVQAEVGLFIELANGKFRKLALAGIAKCILPTEDEELLHIEFQVLGIIDFSEDTLSIDASLENSFVLIFHLDGDMALRACWGANPRFALSMGGFYPGFVAPKGFPQLKRMSISLDSDNPRIGLLAYMAVTENSFQIGAALLFHYEKDIGWPVGFFEVDGGLGFDALFEFNPFSFETMIYAYLTLKRNHEKFASIKLDIALSGPNNWHAVGHAEFSIIGIGVRVGFDETFGDKKPETPLPPASLLEVLKSELDDQHNWSVLPPRWGAGKVIFRKNVENEAYVDTFGEVCFRQKSIPFKLKLQKYGNSPIRPEESYFDIKAEGSRPVEDLFSPGTYEILTDQQKVSAPAFEQMCSGLIISINTIGLSADVQNNKVIVYDKILSYETVIKTSKGAVPFKELVASNSVKLQPNLQHLPMKKVITDGEVTPDFLLNSQRISGQKYHNKFNAKSPSAMANRISVKEQKFAVISSEAIDGKFKAGKAEADIPFARAAQLKQNKGYTDAHVIGISKAVIV
jgi:hypothetical protein